MSSYLYASSNAQSINGETYAVRIIQNTSGSDSTREFDLGPQGVKLIYENTDDTLLLPGIVHSRCEVETLWPSGSSTLSTLITNLLNAQDGDWLLEVLRDSERIWVGTILCEQVDITESSPVQSLRIVATDGLSLLKNVDYNDNGTAYTGFHVIFDDILTNIQEKWTTYDYLSAQTLSGNVRLEMADDVYSTDDILMSLLSHPAGTLYANTRRMRIHTHAFSETDNAGNTTFISCYELLESICLTLQLRMYYYGNTWSFIPAALSDENITGYRLTYGGTNTTATIVGTSPYQTSTANDTRQKGNEWVQSFTPQINEVNLTRDTNKGYEIIAAYNIGSAAVQSQSTLTFASSSASQSDEGYLLKFTAYVENAAISKAASEALGRIVFRFTIQFGTGADATLYKNELTPHPAGRIDEYSLQSADFTSQDYAPFNVTLVGYSAASGTYDYHRAESSAYYYDFTTAGSRYLEGAVLVPPPPAEKTGVTIIPQILAFDSFGNLDTAGTAALTREFVSLYFVAYSNDNLGIVPNFTWRASNTFGRGKINLGTTHIGGLGVGMGSIQVETATGVFNLTDNWVNQASSTQRPVNKLCVEEILASHYRPRTVQRGSIVLRGSNATPGKPFSRYQDNDTGEFFAPLNWTLCSTQCEMQLTLRKIGRNAVGITTEAVDSGDPLRLPFDTNEGQSDTRPTNIMFSYNTQSRANFAGDWSAVINTETIEMYYTLANDGQGTFMAPQGQVPDTPGATIVRKVYVNTKGLQTRTDSGWTSPAALQPADNATLSDCRDLIREYIAKVDDHGAYTFVVSYSEVSTLPLLNTYANSQAAYSLRKLNSSYSGPAINVRRTSPTAASQDIGFTAAGVLDVGALSTFCGSGDGFVQIWYDQSGNGRNASQASTALQPKIFSSGFTLYVNSKPAVQFNGDYLDTSAFAPNPNDEVNAAGVVQFDTIDTRQSAASQWGGSGQQNFFFQMQEVIDGLRFGYRYTDNSLPYEDQVATATADTQYLMSAKFEVGDIHVLYNNAAGSQTNTPGATAKPNNKTRALRLGGLSSNTTQLMTGFMQEWVMWSNATAHDHSAIGSDINDYYSVY